MLRVAPLALVLLLSGCSAMFDFDRFSGASDDGGVDSGPVDTGTDSTLDAGDSDVGPADAGDAGDADAGCSCACSSDSCDGAGVCQPVVTALEVATGSGHTCALSSDNEVYCWGRNANGQLGLGTTDASDVPRAVALSATPRAVGAGGAHSCAVLDVGAACWGLNGFGQLGDDSNTDRLTPVMVDMRMGMGPYRDRIALSDEHTCALTDDDPNTWCWGRGREGQLGDNTFVTKDIPVRVPSNVFGTLTAGYRHACAIDDRLRLLCWGSDDDGQLGNGAGDSTGTPTVVNGGADYRDVSAGVQHTCGVTTGGELRCWGRGGVGQLGEAPSSGRVENPRLVGTDTDWVNVAAGDTHTCALKSDGSVFCFGSNMRGALGLGDENPVDGPTAVVGTIRWDQLSGGGEFTCGIDRLGRLFCWGQNDIGQLGLGDRMDRSRPVRVCLGDS